MTAESSRSPSREQALGKKSEDDIDSEKGLKRRKLDNHNVKTGQSASSHSDSDVIKLKVASRKSPLALWQTNHVIQLLQNKKNFKLEFEIVEQATIGDKVLDKHLSVLGKEEVTKAQNQATVSSCGSVSSSSSTGIAAATTAPTASGLFTKELELQLLSNEADFAVHSLKDMPTRLPEGLSLVCIPERADESDCVVVAPKWRQQGVQSLEELWKLKKKQQSVQSKNQSQCQPNLALVIGSSSLRRESLLKRYFNNSFKCNTKLKQDSESQSDSEMRNIQVETIRGNVQTRLRKLEEPKEGDVQYDCIILASIGLERVELGHKIEFALPMTKEDDWEQRSLDVMLSSTKKSNSSNSESKLVPESDSDSNVKSTVKSGLAFPYCVSQGALGIECRTNDIQTINILKQIACPEATLRCSAERGLLNALDGGCQISMGVMSEIKFQFSNCRNMFYLETIILSRDGKEEVSGRIEEDVSDIITGWRDKLDDQYYPQIQDHNDKDAESDNRNPATDNISKIDEITKLGDEIGRELARKLKNDDPKISAIIKRLTTDVTDAELRDSAENNVRQISRPITYGSAETAGIVTEGFKEKT